MSLKTKASRTLSRATSDKTELNRAVLKWKKQFDEASKVLSADRKKKR